jgi:hypothetical protein
VSGPAWGQDYPNRQITILVGIAAGGITDVIRGTMWPSLRLEAKGLDQLLHVLDLVSHKPAHLLRRAAGDNVAVPALPWMCRYLKRWY